MSRGSLRWPPLPGSGSNCRTGGGAIWVESEETLMLNGTVGANGSGTSGGNSGYHASAGGSSTLGSGAKDLLACGVAPSSSSCEKPNGRGE